MTKSLRRYVMTGRVMSRLRNKYGQVVCYTCGKPIRDGDRVVGWSHRGPHNYKIRHEGCYEATQISPAQSGPQNEERV